MRLVKTIGGDLIGDVMVTDGVNEDSAKSQSTNGKEHGLCVYAYMRLNGSDQIIL